MRSVVFGVAGSVVALVACSSSSTDRRSNGAQADTTGAASDLVVWNCPAMECFFRNAQGAGYIAGDVTFSTCRSASQGSADALADSGALCADAFAQPGATLNGLETDTCSPTAEACSREGVDPATVASTPAGPGVLWNCAGIECLEGSSVIGTVAYTTCQPAEDPHSFALDDNGIMTCDLVFGPSATSATNPSDCTATTTACAVGSPLENIAPPPPPPDAGAGPDGGGPGDGGVACAPQPTSGFTTSSVSPVPSYACSSTQITTFVDSCVDATATQAACDAWYADSANGACNQCLYTPETATHWGPIVYWSNPGTYFRFNWGGCIQLLDPANASCGAAWSAVDQCVTYSCVETPGNCTVDSAGETTAEGEAIAACEDAAFATSSLCGAEADLTNTGCASEDAGGPAFPCYDVVGIAPGGGAATSPPAESSYVAFLSAFCGGGG